MELRSEAFENEGEIPKRFTCEGQDVSPPLSWSGVPQDAHSLALVCEDPDAPLGVFAHWLIYDIPAGQRSLGEDRPKEPVLLGGAKQGKNSFQRVGYGGPCPPNGPYHRYIFTLYALDKPMGLAAGATRSEVERAMRGHILASARLMGRFRKVSLRSFVRAMLHR